MQRQGQSEVGGWGAGGLARKEREGVVGGSEVEVVAVDGDERERGGRREDVRRGEGPGFPGPSLVQRG